MWSWLSCRPQCSLKIGKQELAWVECQRGWRRRVRYRCKTVGLPEDLVRPSPIDLNVARPQELVSHIRELVKSPSHADGKVRDRVESLRSTALVLPDLSVRLAVLRLDKIPRRKEERDALIRWRLSQEQLLPQAGTKVFAQVLPASSRRTQKCHTVVAVAVQDEILSQYESICEQAGLLSQEVTVGSMRLFNLWLRISDSPSHLLDDLVWVNVADETLTVFLFHTDTLIFTRTKSLIPAPHQDSSAMMSDDRAVRRVVDECAASIYACQQQHAAFAGKTLVLVRDQEAYPGLSERITQELGLQVREFTWESVRAKGRVGESRQSHTALPAMAAVV